MACCAITYSYIAVKDQIVFQLRGTGASRVFPLFVCPFTKKFARIMQKRKKIHAQKKKK